jgi:hypothetical protein
MVSFSDLEFKPRNPLTGGVQARYNFYNGYSASVIKGPYTYGGLKGLYKLAICIGNLLVYDTPITDDVLGWLTPEDVTKILIQIEALPPRGEANAS